MGYQQSLGAALVCAVIGCQAACAQVGQPAPGNAAQTPGTAMRLNVVLSGGSTDGLQMSEVKLLDNGSPANVQSLRAADEPAHVVLILDDVNARLTTIAYERDELKKFFTKNEGQLSAPLAIGIMTDTNLEVQQTFSQNGIAANDALQKYKIGLHEITHNSQYGGWERTQIGVRALEQLVVSLGRIPGHKLIVFVSPGWPLLSGARVDLTGEQQRGIFQQVAQLQDALLRADITLDMVNPFGPGESLFRADNYEAYLKGISKPKDIDLADLSLQVLAVHSGGTVQQGTSDVEGMVARSLGNLTHSYTLAFVPGLAETPNGYHSLKLEVSRPGVTVHMPDEYYARTSPAAASR